MFDLKFYYKLKMIREHINWMSDYNNLRDCVKRRDYFVNLYSEFFKKIDIDELNFKALNMYMIWNEIYFSDYDEDCINKMYDYYKKNVGNPRKMYIFTP